MVFSSILPNPEASLELCGARLVIEAGVRRGYAAQLNADGRSISGLRGAA
jgi:hypothetical protein